MAIAVCCRCNTASAQTTLGFYNVICADKSIHFLSSKDNTSPVASKETPLRIEAEIFPHKTGASCLKYCGKFDGAGRRY